MHAPRNSWFKILWSVALLALAALAATAPRLQAEPVKPERINNGWKFMASDPPNAQAPTMDDSSWRTVELPHDWSIEGRISRNNPMGGAGGFFPSGVGWYRRHLAAPAAWKGKRISLEFEGVYMKADVWLNGRHLAFHPYGYTSFLVELTPALKEGDNTLAVRVDNSKQLNSRWYSGSGIYRNVWLRVSDPVHFEPWSLAVTTPEVSADKARMVYTVKLVNDDATTRAVELQTTLAAPGQGQAGRQQNRCQLAPGGSKVVTQEMTVNKPELWSPDSPKLYHLEVSLSAGGAADAIEADCGIRTISVSAEKGFQLNGRTIKLDGGCIHHDNGCLGAAALDRAEVRRVELLKAAGFNAIRTAHNPPSPAFLDACDRLGLLVLDEAFDCWDKGKNKNDYSAAFNEWWQRDIDAMVLRDAIIPRS